MGNCFFYTLLIYLLTIPYFLQKNILKFIIAYEIKSHVMASPSQT